MTVIVNVASISKSYGGIHHVLSDCSLEIPYGKKIGMVGPNGAGKSTLFKLIADWEQPDSGAIFRLPGTRIGYLAQEPTFPAGQCVRDTALGGSRAMAALTRRMKCALSRIARSLGGLRMTRVSAHRS